MASLPTLRLTIAGGALAALYLAPAVVAQTSSELLVRHYGDPDEFYLMDQTDMKVLEYNEPRDVRICNDTRRHNVPLEINHDGKRTKVRPGDCFSFEAKTVSIRAAESLGANLDLSGTVEHHSVLRASERRMRSAMGPQPQPRSGASGADAPSADTQSSSTSASGAPATQRPVDPTPPPPPARELPQGEITYDSDSSAGDVNPDGTSSQNDPPRR